MRNIPTDLDILNAIYEKYYNEFVAYPGDNPNRSSKAFVPIDIAAIADELNVDPDIVFGRLYYDLEKRYGYKTGETIRVSLFSLKEGSEFPRVHFPYLSSILADIRQDDKKYRQAIAFAAISATVAFISLVVSLVALLNK